MSEVTSNWAARLDERLDRILQAVAAQNQKIEGLLDLATGTRTDFAGFMKLYSAQEDAVSRIAGTWSLLKSASAWLIAPRGRVRIIRPFCQLPLLPRCSP